MCLRQLPPFLLLPPSFIFLPFSPPSLTSSLGMHHPLWDPLPVEVSHLIEVHCVLHHLRPTGAHSYDVLLVINWDALAGGQPLFVLFINVYVTNEVEW